MTTAVARRKAPAILDDLLDQLVAGDDAASRMNSGDVANALKKALANTLWALAVSREGAFWCRSDCDRPHPPRSTLVLMADELE